MTTILGQEGSPFQKGFLRARDDEQVREFEAHLDSHGVPSERVTVVTNLAPAVQYLKAL